MVSIMIQKAKLEGQRDMLFSISSVSVTGPGSHVIVLVSIFGPCVSVYWLLVRMIRIAYEAASIGSKSSICMGADYAALFYLCSVQYPRELCQHISSARSDVTCVRVTGPRYTTGSNAVLSKASFVAELNKSSKNTLHKTCYR